MALAPEPVDERRDNTDVTIEEKVNKKPSFCRNLFTIIQELHVNQYSNYHPHE